MKFIIFYLSLLIVLSGCTLTTPKKQVDDLAVFKPMLEKEYGNLDMSAAYDMIEPYIKSWSEDAYLHFYETNIPDNELNFQSHRFDFWSNSKKTNLMITYNFKEGYKVGDGKISLYDVREKNDKFHIFKETVTSSTSKEVRDEIDELVSKKLDIKKIKYSDVQVIKAAENKGFFDFKKNTGEITINHLYISEAEDDRLKWLLIYGKGIDTNRKVFSLTIDAVTGEILNLKINN